VGAISLPVWCSHSVAASNCSARAVWRARKAVACRDADGVIPTDPPRDQGAAALRARLQQAHDDRMPPSLGIAQVSPAHSTKERVKNRFHHCIERSHAFLSTLVLAPGSMRGSREGLHY